MNYKLKKCKLNINKKYNKKQCYNNNNLLYQMFKIKIKIKKIRKSLSSDIIYKRLILNLI